MISLQDIRDAAQRIAPYINHTPLLRTPALDPLVGAVVYLKPENLQVIGAFKIRGASNALLSLTEDEKAKGVIACSSGNHGQAVAYMSHKLGIDAKIVMPENYNPVKKAGVESWGGTVILHGIKSSERAEKALEIAEKEGRTFIHPYMNDNVKAGQGTIGLEILEDCPDIDTVCVPVGGGGLIGGISVAIKNIRPKTRIVGVEPTGAMRYAISRELGRPIKLPNTDTIADGTRGNIAVQCNFEIIERYVEELIDATNDEVCAGLRAIVSKAKLVAEPSSVMGLGAAISGKLNCRPDEKVCFVLSAGNNNVEFLAKVLLGEA